MANIREKYKEHFKKYKRISIIYENKFNIIYNAEYKETGDKVILKVYTNELIEKGPEELLYKQIKREIELTQLCQCDNVIKLYNNKDEIDKIIKKIEKEDIDIIILEYEYCYYESLVNEIGHMSRDEDEKKLFVNIVRSLAKALKVLYEKRVIHRDIKPYNIYIQKKDLELDDSVSSKINNIIIKLGDFSSSIKFEENDSKQIGTILYASPEIIKNSKYDEKTDIWSLGITLYHLYFGFPPYGKVDDFKLIREKIYSNNFIFRFSGIPTLDILFKKMLAIDPKERMTHEEFYEYVFNDDFMKPDIIYKKDIYENIYNEIKKIKNTDEYKLLLDKLEKYEKEAKEIEGKEEETKLRKQIMTIVKITPTPHILDLYSSMENMIKQIDEKRFINIIYYNEDPENLNDVIDEINYFEEQTTGAFIYCNSIDKLDIILDEINNCYDYNYNKYNFELIVSGKNYDKSMTKISNKNYERYFNHICIFDKEGYKTKEDVLQKFIKKIKSKKIKPYPINKLVTYEEYKNKVKYFCGHLLISAFYGKLDKELYINNKNKIKELIYKDENNKKEEDKNNKKDDKKDVIFKSFDKFDIDTMNEEIIKEYTNHTFYGDLNRWLREINIFSFDQVAYFTSRLMLSLNQYGEKENKYYKDEKVVYRGMNLDYISLLNYERAKNKIIILTSFTSTTEKKSISDNFAKKYSNDKYNFSVVFYITNSYKENWKSNGVDIQKISILKEEKEILYQAFSFYFVIDVIIDIEKQEAKIYLKTIGKKNILEEKIREGKEIQYNQKENIVEPI